MFDLVQRLFHWADFMVLGLMALTGVGMLSGSVDAFLAPLGVSGFAGKVYWHVTLAWGLLMLILLHVFWDMVVARGWRNIIPTRGDFVDAGTRARNFLGLTQDYPRSPKYDMFMKAFHWGLTVSLIILGVTGLYFWNPYGLFPGLSYRVEFLFRLLHDFFAFLLLGLIIGHMYFALLPVNWPILKGMVVGYITSEDFMKHFSLGKWKPEPYLMTSLRAHATPRVRARSKS
jgi:cytochrome b subunit of formate dehydrogenase